MQRWHRRQNSRRNLRQGWHVLHSATWRKPGEEDGQKNCKCYLHAQNSNHATWRRSCADGPSYRRARLHIQHEQVVPVLRYMPIHRLRCPSVRRSSRRAHHRYGLLMRRFKMRSSLARRCAVLICSPQSISRRAFVSTRGQNAQIRPSLQTMRSHVPYRQGSFRCSYAGFPTPCLRLR